MVAVTITRTDASGRTISTSTQEVSSKKAQSLTPSAPSVSSGGGVRSAGGGSRSSTAGTTRGGTETVDALGHRTITASPESARRIQTSGMSFAQRQAESVRTTPKRDISEFESIGWEKAGGSGRTQRWRAVSTLRPGVGEQQKGPTTLQPTITRPVSSYTNVKGREVFMQGLTQTVSPEGLVTIRNARGDVISQGYTQSAEAQSYIQGVTTAEKEAERYNSTQEFLVSEANKRLQKEAEAESTRQLELANRPRGMAYIPDLTTWELIKAGASGLKKGTGGAIESIKQTIEERKEAQKQRSTEIDAWTKSVEENPFSIYNYVQEKGGRVRVVPKEGWAVSPPNWGSSALRGATTEEISAVRQRIEPKELRSPEITIGPVFKVNIGKEPKITKITTREEYMQYLERKESPLRTRIFEPTERWIESIDKAARKTLYISPYLTVGTGIAAGGLGYVKSFAHPIKSVKGIYYAATHPFETGASFREHLEEKGLGYTFGEFVGVAAVSAGIGKMFKPIPEIEGKWSYVTYGDTRLAKVAKILKGHPKGRQGFWTKEIHFPQTKNIHKLLTMRAVNPDVTPSLFTKFKSLFNLAPTRELTSPLNIKQYAQLTNVAKALAELKRTGAGSFKKQVRLYGATRYIPKEARNLLVKDILKGKTAGLGGISYKTQSFYQTIKKLQQQKLISDVQAKTFKYSTDIDVALKGTIFEKVPKFNIKGIAQLTKGGKLNKELLTGYINVMPKLKFSKLYNVKVIKAVEKLMQKKNIPIEKLGLHKVQQTLFKGLPKSEKQLFTGFIYQKALFKELAKRGLVSKKAFSQFSLENPLYEMKGGKLTALKDIDLKNIMRDMKATTSTLQKEVKLLKNTKEYLIRNKDIVVKKQLLQVFEKDITTGKPLARTPIGLPKAFVARILKSHGKRFSLSRIQSKSLSTPEKQVSIFDIGNPSKLNKFLHPIKRIQELRSLKKSPIVTLGGKPLVKGQRFKDLLRDYYDMVKQVGAEKQMKSLRTAELLKEMNILKARLKFRGASEIKNIKQYASVRNLQLTQKGVPSRITTLEGTKFDLVQKVGGKEVKVADLLDKRYGEFGKEFGASPTQSTSGTIAEATKNYIRALQSPTKENVLRSQILTYKIFKQMYTKPMGKAQIRAFNRAVELIAKEKAPKGTIGRFVERHTPLDIERIGMVWKHKTDVVRSKIPTYKQLATGLFEGEITKRMAPGYRGLGGLSLAPSAIKQSLKAGNIQSIRNVISNWKLRNQAVKIATNVKSGISTKTKLISNLLKKDRQLAEAYGESNLLNFMESERRLSTYYMYPVAATKVTPYAYLYTPKPTYYAPVPKATYYKAAPVYTPLKAYPVTPSYPTLEITPTPYVAALYTPTPTPPGPYIPPPPPPPPPPPYVPVTPPIYPVPPIPKWFNLKLYPFIKPKKKRKWEKEGKRKFYPTRNLPAIETNIEKVYKTKFQKEISGLETFRPLPFKRLKGAKFKAPKFVEQIKIPKFKPFKIGGMKIR